jgi:hypothetical protein
VKPALAYRIAGQNHAGQRNRFELLTYGADESYEAYVRRIAATSGPAGRLARPVKLADLGEQLAHETIPEDAPPYAWARAELLTADRA